MGQLEKITILRYLSTAMKGGIEVTIGQLYSAGFQPMDVTGLLTAGHLVGATRPPGYEDNDFPPESTIVIKEAGIQHLASLDSQLSKAS